MSFPSYLGTMPMHAITEIYGEPGLRERYRLEIERFAPPERDRLAAALDLAGELHRDDRRVREPYVNHLLRVAIRIMHHYAVSDVDVIAAAVLHDTVEDHPAELAGHPGATAGQALAVLAGRFGDRVAGLVAAVTNPEYDPSSDKHEQYREHVRASLERDPWARVIKVSDFTDNGVGVIHTTGPKVERSAAKYRPLVPVLRELVGRPDTPLTRLVKEHIFRQLDLAEERFAAILDRP
ncbi:HD domain-containing protein [Dactylosporangium sp. CA-139114]|uniref:HD domain-containing protein n=1 Tax=Dactylosporangium sp. CA-139114 TaxID=3239931 RepID=UPI003D95B5AF